ncbi:S8 family peptidase [Ideonella sp.]|uniref:S8 family peptidase n=1 Tax=Ideonella sp. TaxID=1929293 RepID=UPI002B46F58D|nr:S8 family serine peptidase [Ideonella sp.]HJV71025.1 S8 family serine peptidase [Ideonella sp.]
MKRPRIGSLALASTLALGAGLALGLGLAGCAHAPVPDVPALVGGAPAGEAGRVVVIAIANPVGELPLSSGSTPGLYSKKPGYVVGTRADEVLAAVAQAHGLRPLDSWPIRALGVHCATFLIPDGASRDAVLAALARDPRVALAQPLNEFDTLAAPASLSAPAPAVPVPAKGPESLYNDPYFPLQRGLLALGVPQAHRCARGDGVRVAVIDTGVDTAHQDLAGTAADTANFVDRDGARFQRDRHGTEVAGVIAARPDNATGIVGIAPGARLLALKACWERADGASTCNSFTLSQALAAAIDRGAQVINLSLGGPADELLTQLLRVALAHGTVIVGAVPPGGARDGFPLGVPGVIAVQDGATPASTTQGPLGAPAREVLTLMPGGRYDFASGTSMAAAQVSGIAALLLQHHPRLDGSRIEQLLRDSRGGDTLAQVNACRALEALEPGCGCSAVR